MRTTVVSTAVPNERSGSGASITLALIAQALHDRGHEVSLCPVVFPEYVTPDGAGHEEQLQHAASLGYSLEPVVSEGWRPRAPAGGLVARVRRVWRPPPYELYPTLADGDAVADAVAGLRPDAVLVYGFPAVAAARSVAVPRFAATSDPPHLPLREQARRRWRRERNPVRIAREAVILRGMVRAHVRLARELLRGYDAVGAFGPQHADWIRSLGIPCDYYRTPIADPSPVPARPAGSRPTILLVGHLRGTATLNGLDMFRAVLPELERRLGRDGFVVRVVGGYEPPPELVGLMRHPAVQLAGFVEDIAAEFRSADVLLVPVSTRLGVRVRILTGFAFGACIVAHAANAAGIPELEHERNALLASDAAGLAHEVARAVDDRALRERLGAGARATYEQTFAPDVAGRPLARTLERIAGVAAA